MFSCHARRGLTLAAIALAACSSDYTDAGYQTMTPMAAGSAGSRPNMTPTAGARSMTEAVGAMPTAAADRGSVPPSAGSNAASGGAGARADVTATAGATGTHTNCAATGAAGSGASCATAGAGAQCAGMDCAPASGGAGASADSPTAGTAADSGAAPTGTCCDDGDCLCHGPAPTELSTRPGPYRTERSVVGSGTLHYPVDAEPPFAAVALCGGFLNTGPEMDSWGPMYASHGIVTVIVSTDGADIPEIRAARLLAAIDELKELNNDSSSPLHGKLSGRYGTSGYSMGGGGTTIASGQNTELKTSVGLAPWGGSGNGVQTATLLLCGSADSVAPCNMAESVYRGIADSTPKMLITISGSTHFDWFGPADAGRGTSGSYALAFQKVFLEGDTRWKSLLLKEPTSGSVETNID